ncbi:unnamed protein product [Allacma fusca]|uniref:Uncharacterized protein n=1 Tax=Allacma fusca TaxID=39272 RepID=A0A8J2JSK1_9HEXA|nr:unnamed protein product [Allacma fusca]
MKRPPLSPNKLLKVRSEPLLDEGGSRKLKQLIIAYYLNSRSQSLSTRYFIVFDEFFTTLKIILQCWEFWRRFIW